MNRRVRSAGFVFTAVLVLLRANTGIAYAQDAPGSSPSPSPSPVPGTITWSLDGQNLYIDQRTHGAGITPPEGAEFGNGSPLSPNTPYDLWTSAVQIPGTAALLQYRVTPAYHGRSFDASLQLGAGFSSGSTANLMYWGENLLPTFNPHLGNQALRYAIIFPVSANSDYATAFRFSVLSGALSARDGSWAARAGYFDLTQSERFVFIQPAFTSVTPALGVAPAETLNAQPPLLDSWPSPEPGLPLLGVDVTANRGLASFELSSAALPALPGTSAHITIGSAVIDHGQGTRYAAEFLHLSTGGLPISTTTMYGAGATTVGGPQGELPVSVLGGQRATIAGVAASFHVSGSLEAAIQAARQWYDAAGVFEPGTQRPGAYYRAALKTKHGRATAAAEWFRFEPRYATAILPYGVPENVWSSAWSWPGQWLKSNYQLNDNTAIGVNRQGFRLKYFVDGGPLEWRAQYANYRQIDAATLANVHQTGFVDGFFLPQLDAFATLGSQAQYAAWLAWHRPFGTITFDYVVDAEHRPAFAQHPEDLVDYVAPQIALTYSRSIAQNAVVAGGYARYGMKGTWATTPLDYGESTYFAGTQIRESKTAATLVQFRHNSFTGLPSEPAGASPDFGANLIIVEERLTI